MFGIAFYAFDWDWTILNKIKNKKFVEMGKGSVNTHEINKRIIISS